MNFLHIINHYMIFQLVQAVVLPPFFSFLLCYYNFFLFFLVIISILFNIFNYLFNHFLFCRFVLFNRFKYCLFRFWRFYRFFNYFRFFYFLFIFFIFFNLISRFFSNALTLILFKCSICFCDNSFIFSVFLHSHLLLQKKKNRDWCSLPSRFGNGIPGHTTRAPPYSRGGRVRTGDLTTASLPPWPPSISVSFMNCCSDIL